MSRFAVCINCLAVMTGYGIRGYPVGHEKGSQRDPYHTELSLCPDCINALESGDMAGFHERYNPNPTVTVDARP